MRTHLGLLAVLAIVSSAVQAEALRLLANEGSPNQTITAKLVSDVYRSINQSVDIYPVPSARATQMMKDGTADGEVGRVWQYGERLPSSLRIEPAVHQFYAGAFSLRARKIQVRQWQDLSNYRVGIRLGIVYAADAVAELPQNLVTKVPSQAQLYKMLRAGRIDVIVDSELNGRICTKEMGNPGEFEFHRVQKFPLYHYLHPSRAALVPTVSAALQAMEKTGELTRLGSRYERELIAATPLGKKLPTATGNADDQQSMISSDTSSCGASPSR